MLELNVPHVSEAAESCYESNGPKCLTPPPSPPYSIPLSFLCKVGNASLFVILFSGVLLFSCVELGDISLESLLILIN